MSQLTTILLVLIIPAVAYLLIQLCEMSFRKLTGVSTKNRLKSGRFLPALKLLINSAAFFAILALLLPALTPIEQIVLATIGLIVALAASPYLRDVFGGIFLLFERPFSVGDHIKYGDVSGKVHRIGLRFTQLEASNEEIINIPNSELGQTSLSITRASKGKNRVNVDLYFPPTTDITEAKEIAHKTAISSPYVFLEKPISIAAANELYNDQIVIKLQLQAFIIDAGYESEFRNEMVEHIMQESNRRDYFAIS